MTTIYVRYDRNYRSMSDDIRRWLADNIGPEGTRYYTESASMQMTEVEDGVFLPTRHFAATFDYDDDATLFKLRWA